MTNGHATPKTSTVSLEYREFQELASASARLSDLVEDILERKGAYKKEFLRGLKQSLREAKRGKLKPVNSILDLK